MTASAPALYDAKRAVFYTKPDPAGLAAPAVVRGVAGLWDLLLAGAHGTAESQRRRCLRGQRDRLVRATSALYHRGNWNRTWNRRLQRLDHVMIFFLIAGTATPAFVLADARHAAARLPDRPVDDYPRRRDHPPGVDERRPRSWSAPCLSVSAGALASRSLPSGSIRVQHREH